MDKHALIKAAVGIVLTPATFTLGLLAYLLIGAAIVAAGLDGAWMYGLAVALVTIPVIATWTVVIRWGTGGSE